MEQEQKPEEPREVAPGWTEEDRRRLKQEMAGPAGQKLKAWLAARNRDTLRDLVVNNRPGKHQELRVYVCGYLDAAEFVYDVMFAEDTE